VRLGYITKPGHKAAQADPIPKALLQTVWGAIGVSDEKVRLWPFVKGRGGAEAALNFAHLASMARR